MSSYRFGRILLLALIGLFVGVSFASAQFNSLRGRYHRRDGLFHTERVRWGGGLTVHGAGVLTHLIDVGGGIVNNQLGGGSGSGSNLSDKETDASDTKDRDAAFEALGLSRSTMEDYVKAQQDANELLRRTEALVSPATGATTNQQSNVSDLERAADLHLAEVEAVKVAREQAQKRREEILSKIDSLRGKILDAEPELEPAPPQPPAPGPAVRPADEDLRDR